MIHFKPFSFGRAEVTVITVLIALALLVIGINTFPAVTHAYDRLNSVWTSWAVSYGYFGAFLASFLGNLTIVIVFPYTIVIFFLATQGLDPLWLGIVTGTGAVLGELSGYVLGRWGSKKFQEARPEEYDALEKILAYRPRFVQWLLFLFSLLPLPDDVLFIPLGMLRYSIWKLLWPSWIGKIGSALFVTYLGNGVYRFLDTSSSTSPASLVSQLGSLFTLTITMYILFKLDWTKIMHRLLDGHTPAKPSVEETKT